MPRVTGRAIRPEVRSDNEPTRAPKPQKSSSPKGQKSAFVETPKSAPVAILPPTKPLTQASPAPVVAPKNPHAFEDAARDAKTLHEAMHGGLTGLGTDEKKLFGVLENKSPEQLAEIKRVYEHHYGKSLEKELTSELSGADLRRGKALLSGDPVQASVEVFRQRTGGLWARDTKDLVHALENLPPAMLAEAKVRYQKDTGHPLEQAIAKVTSGARQAEALGFLNHDPATAYAARLEHALVGGGKDSEALDVLQRTDPAVMGKLEAAYKARTGRSLETDISKSMKGTNRDQALALAKGDLVGAAAARLRDAADGSFLGLGKDAAAALAILETVPPEKRDVLSQRYQALYGTSIQKDVVDRFGGRDHKRLQKALVGGLDDVEKLQIAVSGWGKDSKAITRVLEGRTSAQVAELKAQYAARTGHSLESVLKSELSGRDEFEAMLALEGTPETPEAAIELAHKRRDYERKGAWNLVSRLLLDGMSRDGKRLDGSLKDADKALKAAKADGVITEAERNELAGLTALAEGDVESYRETKQSAADGLATVGAIGVAVATGGAGVGLLAATAAGAATRVAIHGAVAGKSYSLEDAGLDLTKGAIDSFAGGVAGKLAAAPAASLLTRVGRNAALGAGTAFVSTASNKALDSVNWNEGLTEGLFDIGTSASKSALQAAVMGAMTTIVQDMTKVVKGGQLRAVASNLPEGKVDLSTYVSDEATRAALKDALGPTVYDQLRTKMLALQSTNPALAKMAIDDLIGLHAYTGSWYRQMNQVLRGTATEAELLTKLAPIIKTAASGLNTLPSFAGTVYRGTTLQPEALAKYVVGGTIAEMGFTSTTANKGVAFGGNTLFVIDATTGGKAVKDVSAFAREEEILFGPGTQFKVLSNAFDATLNKNVITLKEFP